MWKLRKYNRKYLENENEENNENINMASMKLSTEININNEEEEKKVINESYKIMKKKYLTLERNEMKRK